MKARGDAKLKTLPDALQERFFQELRTTSIAKALEWLKQHHGVESSPSAASEFFRWYPRVGWLKKSASFAEELKATVKALPELKITADQASAVAQVAFEIQAAQDKDASLFLALHKGKIKKAELQLKAEAQSLRLRQYEDKIRHAREALEKARTKGGISPDTLKLIEEQLRLL